VKIEEKEESNENTQNGNSKERDEKLEIYMKRSN
jgi:hypothetical protein